MQPTPPKSRKPQYRRPFYDAGKKTSAEIVAEARPSMQPVETSRPFTPAETNRRLFGTDTSRTTEGRPPSAFSIGPNAFSEPGTRSATRPPSGKLAPLKRVPDVGDSVESFSAEIEATSKHQSKSPLRVRRSSEHLTKVKETSEPGITRSLNDVATLEGDYVRFSDQNSRPSFPSPPKSMEPSMAKANRPSSRQNLSAGRRVHSGPKEHTKMRKEELAQGLKKSNSFGSFERDINSADSGVVRDSVGKRSRPLSSESDVITRDSRSRPLSTESVSSGNESPKETRDTGDSGLESRSDQTGAATGMSKSADIRPDSASSNADGNSQSTLFKENVEPLLKQMDLNHLHQDFDALSINFDVLWKTLELCGLLSKISGSGAARRRSIVLRTIFKFVDTNNAEVTLKLCKLAAVMKVTGTNLVNVCKLIFKISKDKSKDTLFKEQKMISHILEIIRTADINLLFDGIVYATGSIKFLAVNTNLHEELLEANCIERFVDLLSRIREMAAVQSKPIQLSHLLVQASGAIRNIADIPNTRTSFVNNGLIQVLIDLLQPYWKDVDYMLNVSRILSKLTQYGDCSHIVCCKKDSIQILLKALSYHHNRQDIVVRLVFVLGNIAAKEIRFRSNMYFKYGCLDVLLQILNKYMEISHQENKNNDSESSDDAIEKSNEVLVKTVRVIANMSIDANVAIDITNHERCLQMIISIIGKASSKIIEELLINTAATLNNLSFYATEDSVLNKRATELTEALIQLLFIDNMDCIIEATRVFGNFTRSKDIRSLLRERKVVQMLITLLESTDREVVFSACGVLINLMVDNDNRIILKDEGGVCKLTEALRDFGRTDWQLSCMICQTLWNYSEKITSSMSCFGEEETEDLIQILQDYLDPEIALEHSANPEIDEETRELMKQIWSEQFEQVGLRLLNRIEANHTELQPLVEAPD